MFIQAKDGSGSGKWPSVIAEVASIDACTWWATQGNNTIVVWEMPDGTYRGQDALKLQPNGKIGNRARKNGSGTSGYKFLKKQLVPLGELLEIR